LQKVLTAAKKNFQQKIKIGVKNEKADANIESVERNEKNIIS
jgi:hypothetical protein